MSSLRRMSGPRCQRTTQSDNNFDVTYQPKTISPRTTHDNPGHHLWISTVRLSVNLPPTSTNTPQNNLGAHRCFLPRPCFATTLACSASSSSASSVSSWFYSSEKPSTRPSKDSSHLRIIKLRPTGCWREEVLVHQVLGNMVEGEANSPTWKFTQLVPPL
jgi:hypothetical protein